MSLRLKLGLWYGAVTAAIVLLASVLTYAAHTRALYTHLDEALVAAAQAAVAARDGGASPVASVDAAHVPPHIALWFHGPTGVVAATPNADAAPLFDPDAVLSH